MTQFMAAAGSKLLRPLPRFDVTMVAPQHSNACRREGVLRGAQHVRPGGNRAPSKPAGCRHAALAARDYAAQPLYVRTFVAAAGGLLYWSAQASAGMQAAGDGITGVGRC